MLFRKKSKTPAKTHFSVSNCNNCWELYVEEDVFQSETSPYCPPIRKPDVFISYYPEQDKRLAEVAICHGKTQVIMKAPYLMGDTRVLELQPCGYDQNNRHIVTLDHNNIYVALDGMGNFPFGGEHFCYNWSSEIITITSEGQTVMELYPALTTQCIGGMQIKGWINQSHVSYLPYLCGILGYVHLR